MEAAATPARRGPLALLEAAVLISGIGNGIAAVAIPWLILERTGQPTAAGIVGAATALPLLVSALFSGSVVDTLGRRRTSVLSDVLSAMSVAAIPLVDRWLGLDLTLIVVLAVIGSIFDPAGATARETMLPDVSAEARWPLTRANSVHEATWGLSYFIGPGIGGLLIAAVGAVTTLWAVALGFVTSAVLISFVRAPGTGRPEAADRPESLLRGALDGLAFVWHDRLLRAMTIVTMAVVAVYMPIEGVILPVIFQRQGDPQRLGWVLTAMSAGGIAGALSYALVAAKLKRHTAFIGSIVIACVAILAMALAPSYGWLIVTGAIAGFFWGPVDPLMNLAMQTRTPPPMRGRVLGVLMSVGYAAGPIGYLAAGPLVQRFGPEATFVGVGVAIVAVGVAAALTPAFRDFDAPGAWEAHLEVGDLRPPASERGI